MHHIANICNLLFLGFVCLCSVVNHFASHRRITNNAIQQVVWTHLGLACKRSARIPNRWCNVGAYSDLDSDYSDFDVNLKRVYL